MHLETAAIVVAVRAHGEHGAIVRALTPAEGIQAGYVRGGKSRRLRPVLVRAMRYRPTIGPAPRTSCRITVELAHSRAFLPPSLSHRRGSNGRRR